MSKLDDEFEKARKLVNKKLEKSESPEEPFLSQPIGNNSDNKPQPQKPEVIPDIPKPDNLVPPPIPIPDEADEDDEYKIRKCDVEEVIRIRLEEEKKASKVYFTCKGCNLKVIPFEAIKCPNCDLEHKKWNDLETEIQIESELGKVKSLPPKKLTPDDIRKSILEEFDLKKKAEEEYRKSKLKVCKFCGEQVLTHRFVECPECGKREKTPDELELERLKDEELLKVRKAKELRAKQIADARAREEKEDEELMSAFNEVLLKGDNFSKVCKTCLGIDIK